MIAKDLEAKLITAVTSAVAQVGAKIQVLGFWHPFVDEDEDTVAVISVGVATPTSPTYTSSEVTFNGAVSVDVRADLDRDKSVIVAIADALCTLFKTWQSETYQAAFTALDMPSISIDEVSFGGGAVPALNRGNSSNCFSFPFTLAGTYR